MRAGAAAGAFVAALVLALVSVLEGRKELESWAQVVSTGGLLALVVLRRTARRRGTLPDLVVPMQSGDKPSLRSLAGTALGVVVVAGPILAVAWGLSIWEAEGRRAPFTLNGEMSLYHDWGPKLSALDRCEGMGGFSDIVQGTPVKVYDAKGAVVATGALGLGTPSKDKPWCVFPVRVAHVPGRSKFFEVEVSHRGRIKISNKEAREDGFGAYLD